MVTAKRIPRQKARKESNAKLEKSIWYTTAYLTSPLQRKEAERNMPFCL
jgi:hypothetical protein